LQELVVTDQDDEKDNMSGTASDDVQSAAEKQEK
jgi:uncharacterized protein